MIQEFVYPVIEKESRDRNKPIFVGLEHVVPGHEHTSTAIIDGQLPATGTGNATAMAQFEYCFDRADTDKSRGATNQWDCSVPGSANNGLLDPAARKIIVAGGTGTGTAGHIKTVEGVKWMAAKYPKTSYLHPGPPGARGRLQPERQQRLQHRTSAQLQQRRADGVVRLRIDARPPGRRRSAAATAPAQSAAAPTAAPASTQRQIGGVWDALLGEGRNWFFFASSDYHNRGSFGPDQRESTADFYPGEYTKDYVMARTGTSKLGTQAIVDGLRSGNSFVVNGDLIDRLSFVVCAANPGIVAQSQRWRGGSRSGRGRSQEHRRRHRRLRDDGRKTGGPSGHRPDRDRSSCAIRKARTIRPTRSPILR